jgi:hypothetical protein
LQGLVVIVSDQHGPWRRFAFFESRPVGGIAQIEQKGRP